MEKSKSIGRLVGKSVLIMTVTHYFTGRVIRANASEVELSDPAWIADTGRLSVAVRDGTLSEVEPLIDPIIIARGSIVALIPWRHPLPREEK